MPSKRRLVLISVILAGILLAGIVTAIFFTPTQPNNSIGQEGNQDSDGNINLDPIEILSYEPCYELIESITRESGATNYDVSGLLNVTVDNPTDYRIRLSLTVRYSVSMTYTLWGERKTRHGYHKRTTSKTIYEQWKRSYKFQLFYWAFDADKPPNLNITQFDVEMVEVHRQLA